MIKSTDRYLAAAIGGVFAVLVLYLALPRAVSEYFILAGNGTSQARTQTVDETSLRRFAVSRARALEWADDPVHARALARTYQRMLRVASPENRKALVSATAATATRELMGDPLGYIAWWRLALMEDIGARKPVRSAVPYLLQSIAVRTNALNLMPARTDLILSHWWQMTPETRKRLHPQVLIAFQRHRERVLGMTGNPRKLAIIRAVLSETPEQLGAFEGALFKYRKR